MWDLLVSSFPSMAPTLLCIYVSLSLIEPTVGLGATHAVAAATPAYNRHRPQPPPLLCLRALALDLHA